MQKNKLFQHYKIHTKLEELEEAFEQQAILQAKEIEDLSNKIISIDRQITQISLEAEKTIKPRGQNKWSPEAIQCQHECIALVHQKRIAKKEGDIPTTIRLSKHIRRKSRELETILQNQTESWIKKLKIQLDALSSQADQVTKKKRDRMKQQIRSYYEKLIYENIKIATGKLKPPILPQIEVTEGNQSKIISNPDEISQRIQDHNIKHFAQAF